MLSSTVNKNDYTGNGTTETYAYSFKIFAETELVLTVADPDGVETELTITTDYTVTGVLENSGGNIVLVDNGQEWLDANGYLDDDYKLNIKRVLPLMQSADIRNQGDFYPEAHENVFDRLVAIDQQLQEEIDRCFKMPITSGATLELPAPVDGNILMWDGTTGTMVNVPFDGDALLVAISDAETAQAAAETAQGLAETAQGAAETAQGLAEDAQAAAEAARDQAVATLAPGIIHEWGGAIASIPSGWLFCNGAAVSRTTYADLFAAIGTVHGVGDGSTTFNLPDRRDVSPMGAKEDDSGVPKTNVSGSLTQSGGAATHTLTTDEMPEHAHSGVSVAPVSTNPTHGDGVGGPFTRAGSTNNAGGGQAHNILHPYYAAVYMIKT